MTDELRPVGFSDADLLALTRDTREYTPSGDWYDTRGHLLMLYHIARNVNWLNPNWPAPIRPPLVVEIGVREAPSTLALLHAMRETGGHLISLECDVDYADRARWIVGKHGLTKWWTIHVAYSQDWAAECPDGIDVLWIDGHHTAEQVRIELDGYAHKVRPNGWILFHDYWSDPECLQLPTAGPYPSNASEAVEELRRTNRWGAYEVLLMPWSHGLALARKLG